MAIVMSGALPKTNFVAVNLQSNQKTLFSETDSGKTFRRQNKDNILALQ